MPRRGAFKAGGVVGNEHPVKPVLVVEAQCPNHVDVAVVDKHFVVIGDLPPDVPEVDVSDLAGGRELLDRLVDVDVAVHLGDGALAELRHVAVARD